MRAQRRARAVVGRGDALTGESLTRAATLAASNRLDEAPGEVGTVLGAGPARVPGGRGRGTLALLRARAEAAVEARTRVVALRRGQGPSLAAPAAVPAGAARRSGGRWAISGAGRVARLIAGCALLLAGGGLQAGTFQTGGLSFSDELGGARLLAASGTGTARDPIVLVEELAGPGPAILMVRNRRTGHLNVSPAIGFLSLSIVNLIVNRGPWRWAGFDLELRTGPDQPSVYTDGLSFDQPQTFRRIAKADRFEQTRQEDEPFDRIRFDAGGVDPQADLRLDFDILDANGRAVFYLVQRPIVLLAWNDLLPPRQLAALGRDRPARERLR